MVQITEAEVRSLAGRSNPDGVVSCYLDVDGRRHVRPADYERSLANMMRTVRDNGHPAGVLDDLDRISRRVAEGFDRSRVRGVAMFAGGDGLFEVIELPVPVRDQLVVNVSPAVGQLEGVLEESQTLGVLLSDRVHGRIVIYRLDQIEHDETFSGDVDARTDSGGPADRGTPDRHRAEKVNQNLRRFADEMWATHQRRPVDHLIVGASEQTARTLVDALHPYLRDRLHAVVDLEPSATAAEVRAAALAATMEIERRREGALVDKMRDALAAGSLAVAGLDDVLAAIAEERAGTLLVSTGYAHPGWACPACGRLATMGPTCECGAELGQVDNVVEMAIERAMERSIEVEMCTDNADLDVHGRIAAMLRW